MEKEIHVFVTNRGERVTIGVQPSPQHAKETIASIKALSSDERKQLGYSNPRIRILKFGEVGRKQTEILGYRIEPRHGKVDEIGEIAYYLHGDRVMYRLLRHTGRIGGKRVQQKTMFVINQYGNLGEVKGHRHFTDGDGFLEAI